MSPKRYTVHVPDRPEFVYGYDHFTLAMSMAYRLATHQEQDMKPEIAWVIDQSTGRRVYEWTV